MNSTKNFFDNDSNTKSNNEKQNHTPTTNRIKSIFNSNNNFSNSKLSDNNKNSAKSVYSPFVIKKTTENIETNLQGLNLNFNKAENNFTANTSNKNFSKNFFDKNTFSPESQNIFPNNKFYTPSPNLNLMQNNKLSDRFIPCNKGVNLLEKFEMTKNFDHKLLSEDMDFTETEKNEEFNSDLKNSTYQNLLENNFFGYSNNDISHNNNQDSLMKNYGKQGMDIDQGFNRGNIKSKLFQYKNDNKKKASKTPFENIFDSMQSFNTGNRFINDYNTSNLRKFSNKPYKTVEAPGILDDFYLNLLDWSNKNDIAVGLDNSLYLYSTSKNQMFNVFTYDTDKYVSSLIWNSEGTEIAVGNSEGFVEIWDGKGIYYIFLLLIFNFFL